MKYPFGPLVVLSALAALGSAFGQDSAQAERMAVSSLLVLGRPSIAEEPARSLSGKETLAEAIAGFRQQLKQDAVLRRSVATAACVDALGREPTDEEINAWSKDASTYAELVQRHIARLATEPNEYRLVIDRAYQLVIRRPAYDEEHTYWRSQDTLPYALLVGAIENWSQRNAPGLTVTSGTASVSVNSRFLITQRLSRAVANEARGILDLPIWTDVARLQNPDRHVVAAGAGGLASVGGIHFAAAGNGLLFEPRVN
jgi:hypothetical protein